MSRTRGRRRGATPPGRRPIERIFVANRGEIALRIIRAAKDLGIRSIACAAGPDLDLPFAQAADEVIPLPPDGGREPYLDGRLLAGLASRARADAVHPGYGFLSEDHRFAAECARSGLIFIGPPPGAIAAAGDKVRCREAARRAGVPVLPGATVKPGSSAAALRRAAEGVGYPLLIKAAAGGGGRGIRRVPSADDLAGEAEAASREAKAAFGDGRIYLEKEVAEPRHVEVQVLVEGDDRIALFPERDCSVQRRHQKVIEETPSPAVDAALRKGLLEAAARVARAVGYRNAGTMEFLLDPAIRQFFFLEVNARLQVEHPVTEEVTGADLVAWQIAIASGEGLDRDLLGEVPWKGHAIECRITAERPPAFVPSAGRIELLRAPEGPGVRFDTGYREGNEVGARYDSLLAKLIAWGPDRRAALARMLRALGETVILGIDTAVDFLSACIEHPVFRDGAHSIRFIPRHMSDWKPEEAGKPVLQVVEELRRRARPGAPALTGSGWTGPWQAVGGLGAP